MHKNYEAKLNIENDNFCKTAQEIPPDAGYSDNIQLNNRKKS